MPHSHVLIKPAVNVSTVRYKWGKATLWISSCNDKILIPCSLEPDIQKDEMLPSVDFGSRFLEVIDKEFACYIFQIYTDFLS